MNNPKEKEPLIYRSLLTLIGWFFVAGLTFSSGDLAVGGTPPDEIPASIRKPTDLEKRITRVVTKVIQQYHYNQPKFDDRLSEALFEEYFTTLDPNRLYFLTSDLDDFSSQKLILDDLIIMGNVDFSFNVYERLLQRIRERVEYIRETVNDSFDFDKKETLTIDRTEMPWARDKAELDEIWRKRIKNLLLVSEYLMDDDGENLEEAGVTGKEKVLRRHEQYLKFFNENDNADIMEYYLTSLLNIFDPHSNYLNWRTLEDFDITMKLSLTGIGATLKYVDGYTEVVSLVPHGPAEKDGRLQAGDRIIAVGQGKEPSVDVINMPLKKVVRLIRGPKDTQVRLTVIKSLQSAPNVIKLVRDEVKLEDREAKGRIEQRDFDNRKYKLGVINIPSFYRNFKEFNIGMKDAKSSSRDVKRILDGMIKNDQIEGLTIDIRSNGGGALTDAVELTGLFIPAGPVVQHRKRFGVEVLNDTDEKSYYDVPLVVLVNRSSASASEIFSAAIMDYGRGIIVGDQSTHGKGTVQIIYSLDRPGFRIFRDEKPGAIKFTNGKYYRVTGASTQKRGVTPDIVFSSFLDHLETGESYLKHVMPWDEIEPQAIVKGVDVSTLVPEIKLRSEERLRKSVEYQSLKKDIENYGLRKQQKTLSLNKDERLALKEEDEYWIKRSKAVLGRRNRDPGMDRNDDQEDEEKDIYLEETLQVLADLIDMTKKHHLPPYNGANISDKN